MHTTILNDCRDANAAGRQTARVASLLGGSVSFVGVASALEAAGNLIDILDAYGDAAGVVLVNVAPRDGAAKKWKNGTPFGFFRYKRVLVVSSIDDVVLSLVKKLAVTDAVAVLDIEAVGERLVLEKILSPAEALRMRTTQFRSYDFLPRVAAYLLTNEVETHEHLDSAELPDAPPAVWWVDNFGNCKTTLLNTDITVDDDGTVATAWGRMPFHQHLSDVPDGELSVVVGSSGLGEHRFLEIVAQGASAAQTHGISSGDAIF